MTVFASTFVTGLEKPVAELIAKNLRQVKIIKLYDGLVIFSTPSPIREIQKLRFINNSFLVLQEFITSATPNIEAIYDRLIKQPDSIQSAALTKHFSGHPTFRLVTSLENQFVAVSKTKINVLEEIISRQYGLKTDHHKPQVEFWLLFRREKIALFMVRLTTNVSSDKLQPGSLRSEIAHLMCHLAQPSANNLYLDPFAGSGSIPLELARYFPIRVVIAGDQDMGCINPLKSQQKKLKIAKPRMVIKQLDAANLTGIKNNAIDGIITDPPWNEYAKIKNYNSFMAGIMGEFARILKKTGLAVVLLSRKIDLPRIIKTNKIKLTLTDRYDILVSGQKATIYILGKQKIEK